MLRKYFLMPAILSLACVLTLADFAQAQRRGGGNRGGGWGGNRGGFGVYIGPSNPYRSYGNWYGGYGSPYRSYGNPYRYYDSYYYSTPSYYYTPSYYETPSYSLPAQPAPAIDHANIRVIVPDPGARVWFDDRLTSQTGNDRLFNTPSLTSSGTYRIRAAWMEGGNEVTMERTATVSPGQTVVVDFTRR